MATIGVSLILSSGVETLTLELYNAGTLLNTGGDALVEVGTSGYFEADVAEAIVANLDAVIKQEGNAVAGGTLYLGQSQVGRVAGSDAMLAKQDEILAAVGAIEPSLTGPFTRTITVTDSVSGDPIEGVSARLSLAADTESKLTNASGVVSFTVSANTWTYEIFRSGYAGASGTVVVSGSGETAVSLVASPIPPPLVDALLSNCTVTAINQHGDPAVDASVIASSKNPGADDEQIFVFNEDREYLTNASGQTSLPLLRGHRYAITVTFGDFGSRTVLRTIPDEDTFHILVKL